MATALSNEKITEGNKNNTGPITHRTDYEIDLENLLKDARERLKKLKANTEATSEESHAVEEEIQVLESLHENYDDSMNVFRHA